MTTTSPVLVNLQSQWHALDDLDRAKAVNAIKQSGISTRKIAEFLGFSESHLRRLLQALQAPPEDRSLARQGKLSTNELVRRSKAAEIRRATEQRQALELDRNRASIQGCRAICDWIGTEELSGPAGAQIVGEARCRPAEPYADASSYIAWFARWLSLWAAYSMTDSLVRYKAIELALEIQLRR